MTEKEQSQKIQGWLLSREADFLKKIACEQQNQSNSDLLEIGSWKGRSTLAIASVLTGDHRLWVIDHFQGSPEHQKGRRFYRTPRYTRRGKIWVYPDLLENIVRYNIQNKVIILPLSSEAAAKVIDEKFCFIFIDGLHTYEGVLADWNLWSPYLEVGGVCLFHDCHSVSIKKLLDELRNDKNLEVVSEVKSILAFRKGSKNQFVKKVSEIEEVKLCNDCSYLAKQKGVHFFICSNPKSKYSKVLLAHKKIREACPLFIPKTKIEQVPLEWYVKKLRNREYFSFVRYGDGEWFAILRGGGTISAGMQKINSEIQEDMTEALLSSASLPNFIFGMQGFIMRRPLWQKRIDRFIVDHKLNISWVDADVFHRASRDGLLFPLIKEMRNMKIVMIGASFLRELSERVFDYAEFIEIPSKDCYAEQSRINLDILQVHHKLKKDVIYSFCCGPLAEPLISKLHEQMPENFLIDFGSLWDIFCGVRSRGYTKGKSYTGEIINRNLDLNEN